MPGMNGCMTKIGEDDTDSNFGFKAYDDARATLCQHSASPQSKASVRQWQVAMNPFAIVR